MTMKLMVGDKVRCTDPVHSDGLFVFGGIYWVSAVETCVGCQFVAVTDEFGVEIGAGIGWSALRFHVVVPSEVGLDDEPSPRTAPKDYAPVYVPPPALLDYLRTMSLARDPGGRITAGTIAAFYGLRIEAVPATVEFVKA